MKNDWGEIWNEKDKFNYIKLEKHIEQIQEQIDDLEREQPDIYQYYIISDAGYNVLKYHTNEIVWYVPALDVYVWGVTHWGTSWDYVLTNIKIEEN